MGTAIARSESSGLNEAPILSRLFGVDERSLTVFRIGLATLILYDSLSRFLSLPGTAGTAPATPALVRALLIPLAVMLALGFRTRLTTIACWLIYAQGVRAGLLDAGGSVPYERFAITLALFWGMFLPLGNSFSSPFQERKNPPMFLSVASAGFILQVLLIYLSAGITKYPSEWLFERTALLDVLVHPGHGTEFGQALTQFPGLLEFLSVATVAIELFGPIVFLIPGRGIEKRREILVGVFVLFHIGLAATLTLGIFPLVMIAMWTAMLPSSLWARFGRSSSSDPAVVEIDRHFVTNALALSALILVIASNVVTWLWYPATGGAPGLIQTVARQLALYQQWTMFSVPSTL